MRVKKLKNVSNEKITIDLGSNIKAVLPPGADITNIDVTNCEDLEDKAIITYDLTEVVENSSKQKLYD
jgi:hypothetical protein